jgi:hypothetical protein
MSTATFAMLPQTPDSAAKPINNSARRSKQSTQYYIMAVPGTSFIGNSDAHRLHAHRPQGRLSIRIDEVAVVSVWQRCREGEDAV